MKSLDELRALAPAGDGAARVAVVKGADEHALDSVVQAARDGQVFPVLVDDRDAVRRMLGDRLPADGYEVVDVADETEAAATGVRLVREGRADVLMKGHLSSGAFLKPVVNRETGIRTSPVLSHVAVVENPAVGRCIAITDGGMVATPTADTLPAVVEHGVLTMQALGSAAPKVALLSAAEQVIPKLASAELQRDFAAAHAAGEVVVEGPLSLDLALSPAAAAEKHWTGQIRGDAEVLVAPDIVAANALAKGLVLFGGGRMAGVVLGASAPIVLVSRASSADEKYFSLVLARVLGAAGAGRGER